MIKRFIFVLFILCLIISVMVGCDSKSDPATDGTNVEEETTGSDNTQQDETSGSEETSEPEQTSDSEETSNSQPNNNNTSEDQGEVKIDSGRYVGQIDSNSIEIKISGVPDEIAARAFQLSDEVKEKFQEYGFKEGDEVIFDYIPGEPPVIIKISPMK